MYSEICRLNEAISKLSHHNTVVFQEDLQKCAAQDGKDKRTTMGYEEIKL